MGIHRTVVIEKGSVIGPGVTIGPFTVVHSGVEVAAESRIGSHCVLGYGEPGVDEAPSRIGEGAIIRSHSIIYAGSEIAPELETGHHVTIRESARIGRNLRVGTFSDIQGHSQIGDYVRLHSGVFIAQHTTIEDCVWLFPHVVLTDDPHPPSDGHHTGAHIEMYASIGAAALVLPGITVGRDALVAARSLVTRDVRPGAVVAGSPARDRGDASAIQLRNGSGPAYPWRRHFRRGYPQDVVAGWDAEYGD
jgi:acetyltransferase-like isoleucine patch superfamily enzyme